jgi:hypothetical protein
MTKREEQLIDRMDLPPTMVPFKAKDMFGDLNLFAFELGNSTQSSILVNGKPYPATIALLG